MSDGPASVSDLEDSSSPPSVEGEDIHGTDGAPSRARRTAFVFVSTFVAFLGAMSLSFVGVSKIAELVADGLITYMIAMGVTYIAGHSIDRSEVLTRIGESFSRRRGGHSPYNTPSSDGEQ